MSRIWVGFFYFFEIGLGLNTDGFVGGEFLSVGLGWVLFIYLFIFFLRRRRRRILGFWGWDFEGTIFIN